jgi:Probable lipoprotein LpqN
MKTSSRAVAAILAATAIVLATSCTRVIDDARVVAAADMGKAASDGSQCMSVDAPLTSIPDRGDDEPVLKIPQPDGWQRVTMMDSELIRFAMRNSGLERDGLAPTAVVTLESQPDNEDPRVVFDAQHAALEQAIGATDLRARQHTLCGLPAETIDYTAPQMGMLPPHPATSVCVVMHTENRTFAVSITVQSTQPDNPTFKRDAEMILTGFQMLPPTGE